MDDDPAASHHLRDVPKLLRHDGRAAHRPSQDRLVQDRRVPRLFRIVEDARAGAAGGRPLLRDVLRQDGVVRQDHSPRLRGRPKRTRDQDRRPVRDRVSEALELLHVRDVALLR
ncbi:hypothetical protein OG622_27010 [Streptomyces sp. NBC_01314]|nr:hypothetical protein OG622_27010 [Streptomyces sp. NBC_01314]